MDIMLRYKLLLVLLGFIRFGIADDVADAKYLISKISVSGCKLVIRDLSDHMSFMYNGIVNDVKTYLGMVNKSGMNNAKQIVLGCDARGLAVSARVITNKGVNDNNYKKFVDEFSRSYTGVMSSANKAGIFTKYIVSGNLVTLSALRNDYEMSVDIVRNNLIEDTHNLK